MKLKVTFLKLLMKQEVGIYGKTAVAADTQMARASLSSNNSLAPPRGFREHGKGVFTFYQIIFRDQGNSWLDCWDQGNNNLLSIIVYSTMNRR